MKQKHFRHSHANLPFWSNKFSPKKLRDMDTPHQNKVIGTESIWNVFFAGFFVVE